MNRVKRIFILVFLLSANVYAADCADIFPDAAQNTGNGGEITLGTNSQILNSPDNILATRDFNYSGPAGQSCGTADCSQSGTVVPTGDYNSYPAGQSNVTVGFQQTQSITPGNYNNIFVDNEATLNMQPGEYVVRQNLAMDPDSQIVVTGPGTVTIYVRRDINIENRVTINSANNDRHVFLFTRDDIFVDTDSTLNAVLYARDDVILYDGVQVTGAVTANDRLILQDASTITFDSNVVAQTDYGSTFCTQTIPPNLIAEWRLDALAWTGVSGEVLDYSGNNFHGSIVGVGGDFPTTQITSPAISGDPGTCRSGDFQGINGGYVRIDDPGAGSTLDLAEFTVSAWIYPRTNATSGLMTIASKDENWEFHINGSGQVNWWWGGGGRELTTAASVSLNAWQHVAITFESGSQVIYLNGVSAATNSSTAALTLNDDPILIGTDLNFNSRTFNGYIDEVRVYDGPLSATEVAALTTETHPCIPEASLDNFNIDIGAGSASTCIPAEITITARNSSNNVITDYTGTITLSTSTNHGDWLKTATASDALGVINPANDNNDDGAASYTFEASEADQGVITVTLDNHHAESLTITVADTVEGISNTSSSLSFSENAFIVSATDSLGDDIVAGRDHNFRVQMIRNDPTTGSCGPSDNYNASNVKVWLNRAASDPGGTAPVLTNASATNTTSPGSAAPLSDNFTLPFVNGIADFTLNASDVGRYSLSFRDDSLAFSDQAIDGGSSSTYVARPFGFYINVPTNPAAVDESGGVFISAGTDFQVNVSAVAWQSGDDVNNDGIPDGHDQSNLDPSDNAVLSDNSLLANFGQESPAETVTLLHSLVAPTGGAGNFLSSSASPDGRILTSFSGGSANTTNVYFDEVGIIELQAAVSDGDYLGASSFTSRSVSKSGYVGRFIPASFQVSNASITAACVSGLDYSYMGETFDLAYEADALNSLGSITTNYTGVFSKLSTTAGSVSFGAQEASTNVDLSSRLDAATASFRESSTFNWSNGESDIDSQIHVNRSGSPDGPYAQLDIGVLLTDSDGVTLTAATLNLDVNNDTSNDYFLIDQTEVRFGRLRLDDAFGPETQSLPVNFITEYWDGNVWRENTDDSCTAIAFSQINYPSGPASTLVNRTVAIGSGSTTGIYPTATASDVIMNNGNANHSFTAPGAGNTGSFPVDVDLSLYPWLRFDWDNDGSFDDAALPTANFTFGSYRGHDRVIYWQEVLN